MSRPISKRFRQLNAFNGHQAQQKKSPRERIKLERETDIKGVAEFGLGKFKQILGQQPPVTKIRDGRSTDSHLYFFLTSGWHGNSTYTMKFIEKAKEKSSLVHPGDTLRLSPEIFESRISFGCCPNSTFSLGRFRRVSKSEQRSGAECVGMSDCGVLN